MYDQLQGNTATGQYRVEQDGNRRELWLLQGHCCQHAEASDGVRSEPAANHAPKAADARSFSCTITMK